MAVLAVAPAPSTGWALVSDRGSVIGCGQLEPEDIDVAVDHLVRLAHRLGATVEAVVERPPAGHFDLELEFARRMTASSLAVFDLRPVEVRRADWVRSRAAASFAYPDVWDGAPLGDVARRAIGVAAYYLKPGPQLKKTLTGNWTPWRSTVEGEPKRVARARLR